MIIAHINFAKGFRGGERQTALLIQELSFRGYSQKLIVRQHSELIERLNQTKNLEIIQLSKPYAFHLSFIKDSDILHAHETKGAQFCFFAHLFYRLPYLVTRRVDKPVKKNFFNKSIYENSFYTIALSSAIKRRIQQISKKINIKIIPSAYSVIQSDNEKNSLLKTRFSNKFIIGNIGELDNSDKGQFYLIEAMKNIQQKYPNIHLILLGRGKDKEKYQEQSKNLNNITFEGFVNNVPDYISLFDAFIFPSLSEGLGSILFDVIQNKVPIGASNVGGIPDIISDNQTGLLFPPKNSKAIFDTIEKLYLSKELRDKFSQNAYSKIEYFSPQVMAERYISLYDTIK